MFSSNTFTHEQEFPKTCPRCNAGHLRRLPRDSFWKVLISCLVLYPFFCKACGLHIFRARRKNVVRVLTAAVATVLLCAGVIRLKSEQNTQRPPRAKSENTSSYSPPVIA